MSSRLLRAGKASRAPKHIKTDRRWWGQFFKVAIPCVLVLLAMTAGAIHHAVGSHIDYFKGQLEQNAKIGKERIESILKHAEGNLAQTKHSYERYGKWIMPADIEQGLKVDQIAKRDFLGTAVLSPEAGVVEATNPFMAMYGLRHIVNKHTSHDDDETHLNCSTNLQFFLSKRVNGKDGDLAGIVTAELSGHRLNTVTSNLALDSNTRFTISHGGHVHTLADDIHLIAHNADGLKAKILQSVFDTSPILSVTKTLPHGFLVKAEGNVLQYVEGKLKEEYGLLALVALSILFLLWLSTRLANSQRAIREKESVARHKANRDHLTDLYNRRGLIGEFNRLRTLAPKASFGLICVDLDHFKTVNDTLGHAVGDRILEIASKRIRRVLKHGELPVRLGGDEFAVLVPLGQENNSSYDRANEIASQLINILKQPIGVNGQEIRITASVGIAFCPQHGSTLDGLLKCADNALYAAKDEGRDCAKVFVKTMQKAAENKLRLSQAIRHAIKEQQMKIVFQPIYDMQEHSITGFEAIVQWEHPKWGEISSDVFMPIAEEFGLLVELGRYVFEQSCALLAVTPKRVRVAINIAAAQLLDHSTATHFINTLKTSRLDPDRIILEITETIVLSRDDHVLERLNALKDMGFHIALDQFGAGGSSLSHLIDYPFEKIKLSSSVVKALATSDNHRILAGKIIEMAQQLQITPAAEGVDSQAQAKVLESMGCLEIQGLHIGPARSGRDINVKTMQLQANMETARVA